MVHLALAVAALVAAGTVHASNCPVMTNDQRICQETIAKAGATYAKQAMGAIQSCLKLIHSGNLAGDPATVCLGDPPTHAQTAAKLTSYGTKLSQAIPKKCNDAEVAPLGLCSATAAGLGACMATDARNRIDAALGAIYGTIAPTNDAKLKGCQQKLAKETVKLLDASLKATQQCLNSRNKNVCGTAAPLVRCLAPLPTGPAEETALLAALSTARAKFNSKIAQVCSDPEVAALDSCDDDVAGAQTCLACTASNTAQALAGGQYRAIRRAGSGTTFQAAADAAEREDTILLDPGSYVEVVTLKDSDLTVLGLKDCTTGGRAVVTPPNLTVPDGVYHCGSRLLGCPYVADNVLFQGFEVNDFLENDIYSVGVDGVTYRDMITRGPGDGRTRYGLFPVQSRNVLIEDCVATGISDASIYVGQSIGIVIRNNEVYNNVAGIEVENSANAEVYGNYAHDNTAGILFFKLAGLPVQLSNCHYVHDNRAENNNGPNFGVAGLISLLPSGIGMLVLSNDSGTFENNNVTGNKSIGIAVVDQLILNILFTPAPFPTPSPNQNVNDNAFVGNTVTGNGFMPDPAIAAFAQDVVFVPLAHGGNCENGNTFGTDSGGFFGALPACGMPVMPRPGCPVVETTTTTTTTTTSSTTTTTLTWTWSGEVQPLLAGLVPPFPGCAGCHGIASPQYAGFGDIDDPVAGYNDIVNQPSMQLPAMDRIEPGNHLMSYLWHKINGTHGDVGGSGARMPQFGPYLSQEQLDGIAGWIDAGANND
jgi:parallel beta-helix repeat protein